MPTQCCHGFTAFLLKFLNFLQTFIGISIIIYSAYMLNHWHHHHHHDLHGIQFPNFGSIVVSNSVVSALQELNKNSLPAPWFIYAFMGIGVILCCITCIGHIGAEAVNGCCLCYSLLMTTFVLLEVSLVAFIAIDHHWEKVSHLFQIYSSWCRGSILVYLLMVQIRAPVLSLPRIFQWTQLENFTAFAPLFNKIWMFVSGLALLNSAHVVYKNERRGQNSRKSTRLWFLACALVIDLAFSLFLAIILRTLVSSPRLNHDMEGDYDVVGRTREPLLDPRLSQSSGLAKGDARGGHSDIWSSLMREKYHLDGEARHHIPNQNPSRV